MASSTAESSVGATRSMVASAVSESCRRREWRVRKLRVQHHHRERTQGAKMWCVVRLACPACSSSSTVAAAPVSASRLLATCVPLIALADVLVAFVTCSYLCARRHMCEEIHAVHRRGWRSGSVLASRNAPPLDRRSDARLPTQRAPSPPTQLDQHSALQRPRAHCEANRELVRGCVERAGVRNAESQLPNARAGLTPPIRLPLSSP